MSYTNSIEKFLKVKMTHIICAEILILNEVEASGSVQKLLLPIKHTITQYNEFWHAINRVASDQFYVSGVIWLSNGDWIQVYKDTILYMTVPSLPI